MTSLGRRLNRIEAVLWPTSRRGSDLSSKMQSLALERLSDEDLGALEDILEQGKQERQWNERESKAVKALRSAFEQAARQAGYADWQLPAIMRQLVLRSDGGKTVWRCP